MSSSSLSRISGRWLLISAFQLLSFSAFQLNAQTIFVPSGTVGTSPNDNVGIGTSNPASGHLQIQTDANFPGIYLTGNQPGWGSGMMFVNTAPTGKAYGIYSGVSGAFSFSDNAAGIDRIRVESNGNLSLQPTAGNVGIGTSNPQQRFHVVGNSRLNNLDILTAITGGNSRNITFQPDDVSSVNTDYVFNANPGGGAYGTFSLTSAGATRVRFGLESLSPSSFIDTPGNFGVGTQTPAAKLDVNGNMRILGAGGYNATGEQARLLFGDFTNDTDARAGILAEYDYGLKFGVSKNGGGGDFGANSLTAMVIKQESGYVGIGTTAPYNKLAISASAAPIIEVNKSAAVNSGDTLGSIYFTGTSPNYASSITAANPGAAIYATAAATWNGYLPADLVFSTTPPDSANASERMRITSAGNVGIGTQTPGAKLDVAGDTHVVGNFSATGAQHTFGPAFTPLAWGSAGSVDVNGTNGGLLAVYYGGSARGYLHATSTGMELTTQQGLPITINSGLSPTTISGNLVVLGTFSAANWSGTGTTTFSGNVGIGTSSPQAPLEVAGWGARITNSNGNAAQLNLAETNGGHEWALTSWGSAAGGGTLPNKFSIYDNTVGQHRLVIDSSGNVGIGTTSPDKPLTVKGTIHATEVVVDTTVAAKDLKVQPKAWADDVFDDGRPLQPLSAVEQSIKEHKHLPGVPSAQEVAANGVSVADMQTVLLQKIEELTLHQIEQEKRIQKLEAENAVLRGHSTQ